MAVKQKLILDKVLTNNVQVIVSDKTGVYGTNNPEGYGGVTNGNPPSKFERYIFELINLTTNTTYRHIQSDNVGFLGEYTDPSIEQIVQGYNVIIDADEFELMAFPDGLYKLTMGIQISDIYYGIGNVDGEAVTDIDNAQFLYDNYKAIIVGEEIYKIQGVIGNNIALDRFITTGFTEFKPVLDTSITFILSDKLEDCINGAISKFATGCDCAKNTKVVNTLSELQLYRWGIQRCIEKGDVTQAYEYFLLSKSLCSSLNCGCSG